MIKEFIVQLTEQLAKPLPGTQSQFRMLPDGRVKTYYETANLNSAKRGAVMILFYQKNKQFLIPMIQRPMYEGVHSAQIAFPGGKHDPTDVDFKHTALRETDEEIGVSQSKIQVLGSLTEIYIPPSNFLVQPYVGVIMEQPKYYPDINEVADIYEFDARDFLNPENIQTRSVSLFNGLKAFSPCYVIGEKVIWGATAMIISELTDVLKEIDSPFLH